MRYLFVHGWGFDAAFWGPLRAALGDPECAVEDRGYFGAPHSAEATGPYIAVGHSLGAMRVLSNPLPLRRGNDGECVGIVAINGFDRFCGSPGVPRRVVDRMLIRLDREPDATVRDFRARCGTTETFGAPDTGRLRNDLLLLRDGDVTGMASNPILVLHGGADPILSPEHRAATFAGHPRETLADAGHLLPLTHPAWCAQRIADWLRP